MPKVFLAKEHHKEDIKVLIIPSSIDLSYLETEHNQNYN